MLSAILQLRHRFKLTIAIPIPESAFSTTPYELARPSDTHFPATFHQDFPPVSLRLSIFRTLVCGFAAPFARPWLMSHAQYLGSSWLFKISESVLVSEMFLLV
jgi:hypothetical protein